jgi:hypothetical protein
MAFGCARGNGGERLMAFNDWCLGIEIIFLSSVFFALLTFHSSAINSPKALEKLFRSIFFTPVTARRGSLQHFCVVKKRFVHNVAIKSMFSFHYLRPFVDLFSVALSFNSLRRALHHHQASTAEIQTRPDGNELLFAVDFINGKNL